ncbi:hypothetical protein B9Z55_015166 [Caenorhabditis nigoni]|uniref:Uncharacterized protein n=1 Tax=Caenorhabditis nigoni TaxID=1611254 RepID=A0A2G5U9R5_9PELO|nr:hypothetical protein B9Z55_015166 [Caenorhabditis nigoni]
MVLKLEPELLELELLELEVVVLDLELERLELNLDKSNKQRWSTFNISDSMDTNKCHTIWSQSLCQWRIWYQRKLNQSVL